MYRVINLEENIGKTVGRRSAPNPLSLRVGEVEDARHWQRAFGGVRVPRGAYKFRTHEDANAWMMKHLTKSRS